MFLFDENSWEDYEVLSPFLSIQNVMSFMLSCLLVWPSQHDLGNIEMLQDWNHHPV